MFKPGDKVKVVDLKDFDTENLGKWPYMKLGNILTVQQVDIHLVWFEESKGHAWKPFRFELVEATETTKIPDAKTTFKPGDKVLITKPKDVDEYPTWRGS